MFAAFALLLQAVADHHAGTGREWMVILAILLPLLLLLFIIWAGSRRTV